MKKAQRPHEDLRVHVKGKNITITPALHDQVVQKMGRLDKYLDRLQDIQVELHTEPTRDAAHSNCVEATTHVAGRTLRVTAVHEDMYAAIDEAVDKLVRQLNRYKEKMKSHHASRLSESLPPLDNSAAELEGLEGREEQTAKGSPDVRVERLDMKPQFEDEAIQELEAAGHTFYVFLNARNERVNVLYRHSDGGYGLIEPRIR